MVFKASKGKSGWFEVHGIEEFLEQKLADIRKVLGMKRKAPKGAAEDAGKAAVVEPVKPAARAPKAAKAPSKKAPRAKKAAAPRGDALAELLAALDAHPKKAALVKAGKQKDQLLRALIPLYVGRGGTGEVTSGVSSRFWAEQGISFAAPNAAKALREHSGYVKRTQAGNQITPNGVKYVESKLAA